MIFIVRKWLYPCWKNDRCEWLELKEINAVGMVVTKGDCVVLGKQLCVMNKACGLFL